MCTSAEVWKINQMLILAVCAEHVNKAMMPVEVHSLKTLGFCPCFLQLDLLLSAATWERDIAGTSILVVFTWYHLSFYIDWYNGLNGQWATCKCRVIYQVTSGEQQDRSIMKSTRCHTTAGETRFSTHCVISSSWALSMVFTKAGIVWFHQDFCLSTDKHNCIDSFDNVIYSSSDQHCHIYGWIGRSTARAHDPIL